MTRFDRFGVSLTTPNVDRRGLPPGFIFSAWGFVMAGTIVLTRQPGRIARAFGRRHVRRCAIEYGTPGAMRFLGWRVPC